MTFQPQSHGTISGEDHGDTPGYSLSAQNLDDSLVEKLNTRSFHVGPSHCIGHLRIRGGAAIIASNGTARQGYAALLLELREGADLRRRLLAGLLLSGHRSFIALIIISHLRTDPALLPGGTNSSLLKPGCAILKSVLKMSSFDSA